MCSHFRFADLAVASGLVQCGQLVRQPLPPWLASQKACAPSQSRAHPCAPHAAGAGHHHWLRVLPRSQFIVGGISACMSSLSRPIGALQWDVDGLPVLTSSRPCQGFLMKSLGMQAWHMMQSRSFASHRLRPSCNGCLTSPSRPDPVGLTSLVLRSTQPCMFHLHLVFPERSATALS